METKTGIPINAEPKELYEEFRVHEKCIFCKTPTNMWNEETNKPVCEKCAPKHTVEEIKNMLKYKKEMYYQIILSGKAKSWTNDIKLVLEYARVLVKDTPRLYAEAIILCRFGDEKANSHTLSEWVTQEHGKLKRTAIYKYLEYGMPYMFNISGGKTKDDIMVGMVEHPTIGSSDRPVWGLEGMKKVDQVTPILKKLADLTKEQLCEYFEMNDTVEILKTKEQNNGSTCRWEFRFKDPNPKYNGADGYSYSEVRICLVNGERTSKQTLWLWENMIDTFELINLGLAVREREHNI